MTPPEFRARLRALDCLPAEFARFSRADERTVRRWLAGTRDIPTWVPVLLDCLDRIETLEDQVGPDAR